MNQVETEGSSIDEAIERALEQLGVTRDKVDVDIISNSTRGLFGLGGRRARVRATLRTPLDVSATPVDEPRPRPEGRPRPTAESPRPAKESTPVAAAAPPPRVKTPAPVTRVDGQVLERARVALQEMLRLMGSEAQVDAMSNDADGARLVINGDTTGMLIGRRGQTLDALEYVANRIVAREDEHSSHIVVDAQNYRERRRQALEQLAQRLAERARRRGKTVTLNPMSPRDRRIIHLALQNDRLLTTRSAGNGYFRKLLIIPQGDRGEPHGGRPPRRPPRERS
jgi:spoIIIJ-associated protein